jgi:hypothetical protein
MIIVDSGESSVLKQIEFLENVKHYSRSGSAEDRESLKELAASINNLGIQIIPEVSQIIYQIERMGPTSVTYSPTKLHRQTKKVIELLNQKLNQIRNPVLPSGSCPEFEMSDSLRNFLDLGE